MVKTKYLFLNKRSVLNLSLLLLFPFTAELDSSGSYGHGSSSTLPMRGKLPTSGLNGHVHHVPLPLPLPHLHRKSPQDAEIAQLKNFVKHLQVCKIFILGSIFKICIITIMKCRFFHQLSITLRICHFSFIPYYIIHTNLHLHFHTNLCMIGGTITITVYDRWNNIPHYTQTKINGRGPCEPSLTSYYAHHS